MVRKNEIVVNKGDYLWNIRYYPKKGFMKTGLARTKNEALKIARKIKNENSHIKKIRVLKK